MKVIQPEVSVVGSVDGPALLRQIERCGRVCYKSEGMIHPGSAEKFVRNIISRGHEAVLEHGSVTVRFICDRGVSHEIVRHRIAAFCQESTRYCSYDKEKFGNEITVIDPGFAEHDSAEYALWRYACETAEECYMELLRRGWTPQQARDVLPTSLKTELCMTANIREWRHFLKLRCSPAAHPQIRQLSLMLLELLHENIPACFDDLFEEYFSETV